MKRKNSLPFASYLKNEKEKDVSNRTKINYGYIINECCKDWDEVDDEGKLIIVKTILTLLLKLVYGEKDFVLNFEEITRIE